jgi:hypothetical protein
MKKLIITFFILLCINSMSFSIEYFFGGISAEYGSSAWNYFLPALNVGMRITDWTSIETQIGSILYFNQIKIINKFYLFDWIVIAHDFSCFFYLSRPFLTYNAGLGIQIPIFKAALSFKFTWMIWDFLLIDSGDPLYATLMNDYPKNRFNLTLSFTTRFPAIEK